MTFWGAALFQWINVKGWVMVIGTITAYAAIAQLSLEHRHPGRADRCWARLSCTDLGAVRQLAAADR